MEDIDILVVGNALIDTFLFLNSDQHCHESDHGKEFCFSLGAKIPVDDAEFSLGGNACNVSVGLSRLGLKSAIIAETGDDDFSHLVRKGLEKEHVTLDFFKQTQHTPATFSVNLVFTHDRTILSRHIKREHNISLQHASTNWVYLTSLGEEWRPMYERVLEYAIQHTAVLAFNPGSPQLKAGKESFIPILNRTDVLFLNKEEAEDVVYGSEEKSRNIEELLHGLQKLGPKIVSLTDGDKGSYAIDTQGKIYQQDIIPGKFIQKTGVGDAYSSGFLGSLFYNKEDIQQAMLWGAVNASAVIAHMGAQTGLLRKEELEHKIAALHSQ